MRVSVVGAIQVLPKNQNGVQAAAVGYIACQTSLQLDLLTSRVQCDMHEIDFVFLVD